MTREDGVKYDKRRLRKLNRRQANWQRLEREQDLMCRKPKDAASGDVVTIQDCLAQKILVHKNGQRAKIAGFHKVWLHNVSKQIKRLSGGCSGQAILVFGRSVTFPATKKTVDLQQMPLHTHMTLVPEWNGYEPKAPAAKSRKSRQRFNHSKYYEIHLHPSVL